MPCPDLSYRPEGPVEVFANGINTFNRQNLSLIA